MVRAANDAWTRCGDSRSAALLGLHTGMRHEAEGPNNGVMANVAMLKHALVCLRRWAGLLVRLGNGRLP